MTKYDFEKIRGTKLETILIALDAKSPFVTMVDFSKKLNMEGMYGVLCAIAQWAGYLDARVVVNKDRLIERYIELRSLRLRNSKLLATLMLEFDVSESTIKRNLKELAEEGRLNEND